MNDDDVQKQLRAFKAPEPSESAAAAGAASGAHRVSATGFESRAAAGDQERDLELAHGGRGGRHYSCCGALCPAISCPTGPDRFAGLQSPAAPSTRDRRPMTGKFSEQMEQLFPNQINAVVEKNGKVDLSIAQSRVVGSDQPLLVIFKQRR